MRHCGPTAVTHHAELQDGNRAKNSNCNTWLGTDEQRVLDGSSKRQQPHCLQLPAITRYQPSDLRR